MRHLSRLYDLEDPLSCLRRDLPQKSQYKELILTKITAHYENKLRISATGNSLMTYLNVSTLGLRGRHHPALSNMTTTNDVRIARPHLKFLAGNYLTYQIKAEQSGGSPLCRICTSGQEETICHVISSCQQLAVERETFFLEFRQFCSLTKNHIDFDDISKCEENVTQFILDPSSLNLPVRVSLSDPLMSEFFKLCRQLCHIIDKTRIRLLKKMESDKESG